MLPHRTNHLLLLARDPLVQSCGPCDPLSFGGCYAEEVPPLESPVPKSSDKIEEYCSDVFVCGSGNLGEGFTLGASSCQYESICSNGCTVTTTQICGSGGVGDNIPGGSVSGTGGVCSTKTTTKCGDTTTTTIGCQIAFCGSATGGDGRVGTASECAYLDCSGDQPKLRIRFVQAKEEA